MVGSYLLDSNSTQLFKEAPGIKKLTSCGVGGGGMCVERAIRMSLKFICISGNFTPSATVWQVLASYYYYYLLL